MGTTLDRFVNHQLVTVAFLPILASHHTSPTTLQIMKSIVKAPLFQDAAKDKDRQDMESQIDKDKEAEATFKLCMQISQSEVEQSQKVQPLLEKAKVLICGFVSAKTYPKRFRLRLCHKCNLSCRELSPSPGHLQTLHHMRSASTMQGMVTPLLGGEGS